MRPLPLTAVALAALVAGCGAAHRARPGDISPPGPAPSPAPTATATPTPAKVGPGGGGRTDSDGDGIPDAITVRGRVGDTFALQGSGLHDNLSNHTKTRIRVTLQAV